MSENNQNRSERRKTRSPGAKINKICIAVVLVLFAAVFLLNLFQFNRPTVSESEKRTLATWPEFSWKALGDGSYFSGISDFIKDTFWQRDALIDFSSYLDNLKGFAVKVNGEKYVVIDNSAEATQAGEQTTIDLSWLEDLSFPEFTTGTPTTGTPASTADPAGTTGTPGSTETPGTTGTPVQTTEVPFGYVSLNLSETNKSIPAEQALVLHATLQTQGTGTPEKIQWTASPADVLVLTPDNTGTSVTVIGLKAGTASVTATVGSLSATCRLTVTAKESGSDEPEAKEVEGGVFTYGNAFYQRVYYAGDSLNSMAKGYVTVCQKYSQAFKGNPQISFLPCPHATIMLDTGKVTKAGRDQGLILSDMAAQYPSSINFVNVYSAMKPHTDEYLYFKTDHHWTALGAYYAYTAFAQSHGWTPTPLSSMTKKTNTTAYQGSYATWEGKELFKKEPFKSVFDTVDVYYPTKAHTCTVYYLPSEISQVGSATVTYKSCVFGSKSYLAFLSGDRARIEITVPENGGEDGPTILVLHDSYGSAMIPYLTEHYGKIVAVDPRHFMTLYKQPIQDVLGSYEFDEILFLQNIQMANSSNWLQNVWAPLLKQR